EGRAGAPSPSSPRSPAPATPGGSSATPPPRCRIAGSGPIRLDRSRVIVLERLGASGTDELEIALLERSATGPQLDDQDAVRLTPGREARHHRRCRRQSFDAVAAGTCFGLDGNATAELFREPSGEAEPIGLRERHGQPESEDRLCGSGQLVG